MSRPEGRTAATPSSYFDAMWNTGDDPWDHGGRFYERRKYALTASTLRSARYDSMFEPGCATGILTEMLAPRAQAYLATDRHSRAVAVTEKRVVGLPGVRVEQRRMPQEWPSGLFDAIVFSEVLYYLEAADVIMTLDRAAASSEAGAELIAVHYRAPVREHALLGDDVHELIGAHAGWTRCVRHEESLFLLEAFTRR